jgi:hypothetical protein
MSPSRRATEAPRQKSLQFHAVNDRVEAWDGLAERQRRECRQALRQMLVAVVLHSRNAIGDHLKSNY